MANSRAQNVIFADTTGVLPGPAGIICGIKYIGDTGGSAVLRFDSGSGGRAWEANGDVESFDETYIRNPGQNMHITVAGGAVVYIYLK